VAPSAIFFDLDNCLAAADEPGEELLEPVFAAVRSANHGSLSDRALDAALYDCWFHAFDWVARRHGFTDPMRDAGWEAFRQIEVRRPMRGYGDLDTLPSLGDDRFLVTSGFRRLQESKVRALGIAPLFREVIIDAVDDASRTGKEGIFSNLMARYGLRREDVLVVGDNVESELAAARRLGLARVQTLRAGVVPASDVRLRVRNLGELRAVLERWTSGSDGLPS
jgi:FMN phosphatase YigB (HAD superfamily)